MLHKKFLESFKIIDACWLWVGGIDAYGYGFLCVDGKVFKAHRYAYENLISPIPDGLVIDHLCRNRSCVNPQHLEPVTNRENIIRGDGPRLLKERHAAITHCPNGHEYNLENTYISKTKNRQCRICGRERMVRLRASRK